MADSLGDILRAAMAAKWQPNLGMETVGRGMPMPMIEGGLSTPFAGGELGVQGRYLKPMPNEPIRERDWSAMLNYKRQF